MEPGEALLRGNLLSLFSFFPLSYSRVPCFVFYWLYLMISSPSWYTACWIWGLLLCLQGEKHAMSIAGGTNLMPGQTRFSKQDLVFHIIFLYLNYLWLLTKILIHFHVLWMWLMGFWHPDVYHVSVWALPMFVSDHSVLFCSRWGFWNFTDISNFSTKYLHTSAQRFLSILIFV